MHSLADCPLRTFCCITAADYAPFPILNIDFPALDLILSSLQSSTAHSASSVLHSSFSNDNNSLNPSLSEEAILAQRRTRALQFLRGKPVDHLLIVDHESCLMTTDITDDAVQSYVLSNHLLQQLQSFTYNIDSTDSSVSEGCSFKARHTTRRIHGCVHSSAISYSSSSSSTNSPSSPSRLSSHSPLFNSRTTITSSSPSKSPARSQEQQLQDQMVPSWEELLQETERSTMDGSFAESQQTCRVYVLKDVTEMHSLALAARTDALKKERASASRRSAISMPSPWTCSPHTTPATTAPACATITPTPVQQQTQTMTEPLLVAGQEPNVTRQKLYRPKDNLDWSNGHSSFCHQASSSPSSASSSSPSPPYSCPNAPSISPHSLEQEPTTDPGLLLLHITRFGTVDHAITIPQQKQHSIQPNLLLNSQDGRMVTAMTNTSVMSYVHPDDTRAFCQGLDRACKALYTVFRVRWRLEGQEHLLDSDRQHFPFVGAKPKEESVRRIEFQGESFEEYVDPTAVPEASLTTRVSNDGRTLAKYVWAEITGVLSNSQPLLVVRPLTSAELFDQAEEASLAIAVAAAAASSSLVTSSRRSNTRGQLIQEKKGWKTKSKRMDLEEGMRMPKQLNLSALTSLSMSGSRHDEMGLRMPGSLPLSISASSQQLLQQPSQQLMAATRCRNPSGHANPMPSFLAFPSNATLPWSGMFVTIALDAWRQWIQTVHAGQAQFRDWCEYLLEATIDQMIESLSLGLTLLGIEEAPRSIGNTNSTAAVGSYRQLQVEDGVQDESTLQCKSKCVYQKTLQPAHAGTTTTTYITATTTITTTTTTTTYCQQQQLQKAARHQQTLSGLNRAGKILQSKYPSIEGIVRNISNSWLGQKIKTRLEQKLDVVADQVVDWWEAGGEVPLPLPLPRPLASWSSLNRSASSSFSSSSGSSGGATVCELDESDGLLMTESSVVVGVPCENNTPILVD